MDKILGFYHICLINNWKAIVQEQIDLIITSNLYDKTENISVSCLGNSFAKKELLSMLPEKFNIVFHSDNLQYYEIPILKFAQNTSKEDSFLMWYIHTKGVTSSLQYPNMKNWRKLMQYFIIERHQDCIKTIIRPECDACGIEARSTFNKLLLPEKIRSHFSGNFWWSKTDYIKILPDIEKIWLEHNRNRYIAEAFIGMSPKPRLYSLYNTNLELMKKSTPEKTYRSLAIIPKLFDIKTNCPSHIISRLKSKIAFI